MRFITILMLTLAHSSSSHGVEVCCFSQCQSALDRDIDRQSNGRLTVHLENSLNFEKRWIVKDAHTGRIILDQTFEGGETVSIELRASKAGYGEIYYRHPDRSLWSHKSLIADGETISLF